MKDKRTAIKDAQTIYDSYITLQKKIDSDEPSLPLDEYEDYVSLWAESRFIRGKNLYAARAVNVKTDVEWKIRYRTDLDETMRIKYNDKFYEIEGILPLDKSRSYLLIKAYEVKHDM